MDKRGWYRVLVLLPRIIDMYSTNISCYMYTVQCKLCTQIHVQKPTTLELIIVLMLLP